MSLYFDFTLKDSNSENVACYDILRSLHEVKEKKHKGTIVYPSVFVGQK
jgi:hypothetical protein